MLNLASEKVKSAEEQQQQILAKLDEADKEFNAILASQTVSEDRMMPVTASKDLIFTRLQELTDEMHDNDILISNFIEETARLTDMKSQVVNDKDVNSSESIHECIETAIGSLFASLSMIESETANIAIKTSEAKQKLQSKLMRGVI